MPSEPRVAAVPAGKAAAAVHAMGMSVFTGGREGGKDGQRQKDTEVPKLVTLAVSPVAFQEPKSRNGLSPHSARHEVSLVSWFTRSLSGNRRKVFNKNMGFKA